jgi:hypothetical protein
MPLRRRPSLMPPKPNPFPPEIEKLTEEQAEDKLTGLGHVVLNWIRDSQPELAGELAKLGILYRYAMNLQMLAKANILRLQEQGMDQASAMEAAFEMLPYVETIEKPPEEEIEEEFEEKEE